jgi:nitrogen regulatory protein P-II 2
VRRAVKIITAIIKHFRLDELCEALSALGVSGMTIMDVKGYGRLKGAEPEPVVNFLPRVRLDVAVADDQVEKVVAAIKAAVRTGQIGDGKIFVTALEHAVNIRTDETDSHAI